MHCSVAHLWCCCRVASYSGLYEDAGRQWVHNPLGIFCFCAATTHLGSMMTHIYPDSFPLVGAHALDHRAAIAAKGCWISEHETACSGLFSADGTLGW